MMTKGELKYCDGIRARILEMRTFLNSHNLLETVDPFVWHSYVSQLRAIQGNLSNDGSFIASLMAKHFLKSKFSIDFDAAKKPQGAPGIDIDATTDDGIHIVAEIKTTVPYQKVDFGAQQAASFKKDFAKLVAATADYKFMFVTDDSAFTALQKEKYTKLMPGVVIANIVTGEEYAA